MRNTLETDTLFNISRHGRRGVKFPDSDVPHVPLDELLESDLLSRDPPELPELSELDVVRHYTNLSTLNMSIDTHFYPLGSCTMKYNPKRNERLASLPGFAGLHPYQDESTIQGMLQLLHEMQSGLAEIAGLDGVSLQPAAGAHGEMTALMVAAAYFRDQIKQGKTGRRTKVLAPDSAHGTNPASATIAGFEYVEIKSNADGFVDLEDLKNKLDDQVAVFMITVPTTLGLFERQIRQIADLVHQSGALVYLDGANMNAILGIARPGDLGADMMHFNPHKTFSGPHGGGGPGAGPIAVRSFLMSYLPAPIVVKSGEQFKLDFDRPQSIGRVRGFFGNVGVLVRAYCYIRSYGGTGLRQVSEDAVLNANYLLHHIREFLPVPHGHRCMHEFVASASALKAERKISAMDIAKRLLDYGFHSPTVYFPLIVKEALMIEPTETENRQTLDAFVQALRTIIGEDPAVLHGAPLTTSRSRPDEVHAARTPILSSPCGGSCS